jgi:diacylglycerol O-acyltransferase / wax synthase
MDRMTPLDAAFLQAEDEQPAVSLAICSVAVFEGPAPSTVEFAEMLRGRLPFIPRYRQKVRQIPFDLGPPVWVDDEHFDLGYHLRRTALPAPGRDAELSALVGRVMASRLDRTRPLWEYWLVERLHGGRWALISKVHHCMVDGVSGTDLYGVVLDPTPTPRPPEPDDWWPEPEPTSLALSARALVGLVANPVTQVSAAAGALRRPGVLAGRAREAARGLAALSGALVPARRSSLTGPLSPARRFAVARGSVADVSAVRRRYGGTFNDVVLTAVAGGFRQVLLESGEEAAPRTVRALVPVSTRLAGQESIRDNRVSLMLADLPVEVADPVERLEVTRERLEHLKAVHEAEAGATVTGLAALGPFPVVATQVRLAAHLPQRSVVTTATDVPGPRVPLYALGRRLLEIIPYVPIASTVRTGVAILSYCDRLAIGVTGDYGSVPDVEILARGIEDELAALTAAARPRRRRRRPADEPA